MHTQSIRRTALVAVLAAFSVTGHAALIDQGDRTLDTETNLAWLDLSGSIGLSARSILDGTDPDHLGAAGWSHASVSQIETLLLHAGMSGPFTGGLSAGNYPAAAALLGLLGVTGGSIQAFSSTSPEAGKLHTPSLLAFPTFGGADLPGPIVFDTSSNSSMANWLVQAVPEPSTYVMLGLGLGIVAAVSRRRTRAAD